MKASVQVDTIYHLAGMISIMPGRNDLLRSVNILGTRNVIYAARQSKVRKLVYTSSIHALRRVPHGVLIDEMIPFDPQQAISEYDRSKALASLEVQQAAKDGLNAVIACPTGVIGPFDFHRSEMGQIILDCLQRKPQITIEGIYDFVDVRDVADGLIAAARSGITGETYILSGEKLSVRTFLDSIRTLSGIPFLRFHLPNSLVRFFAKLAPTYYRMTHTRPRLTPYALETLSSNANISHAKAKAELLIFAKE
jgi:dihydroflavonol-4-reductase